MWQFYSYIVFLLKFRVWGVTFEGDFSFFVYPRWFNLAHVTQTTTHQFPCSHRSPEICIRHEKSTTMTCSLMINHINTSEASTNTALHLNALFCCEFRTEIHGSLVIAVFWFLLESLSSSTIFKALCVYFIPLLIFSFRNICLRFVFTGGSRWLCTL